MFKKIVMLSLFSLSLSSCLFDRTSVRSSQSSLAGATSPNMSLYVKFSDVTTCSNGAVLTYNGTAFSCVSAGVMTQTNITTGGASYVVTNSQNNVMLTYNDSVDGVISLPSIASVSNGFLITVARQVPYKVLIQTNGADTFQNGKNSFNMTATNTSSVTLIVAQGKWQAVHQTEDCTVGESCWGQNNIYIGTLNGHQYFTTPGGCTDSATPTCAGGNDTVKKAWANNSGTSANGVDTGALDTNDGKAQSAMLATNYTDTDAAKFCENMTYAGYSDWYLPAKMELDFLYRNKANITGLFDDFAGFIPYWSSTEWYSFGSWRFDVSLGAMDYNGQKNNNNNYVRCVRRF
jgi:Protein of unknown function (DUF1566)